MSRYLKIFQLITLFLAFTSFSSLAENNLAQLKNSKNQYKTQKKKKRRRGHRITKISILDQETPDFTSPNNFAVDVIREQCLDGDASVAEPFYDSVLLIDVLNNSEFSSRFNNFSLKIKKINGKVFKSKKQSLSTIAEVPSKGSTSMLALFLKANGDTKEFNNGEIPDSGFKNVKLVLRGRNFLGQRIVLRAKTAVSFSNLDRCP